MRAVQDYHTHTFTSYDGQQTPMALIANRAAAGITHLAITDHADFVSEKPADLQLAYQLGVFGARQRWYDEAAKDGFPIDVAMGAEIGEGIFCPQAAQAFIDAFPFDFIIGSLHRSDGSPDPYCLDFTSFDFIPMLDRYFADMLTFVKWGRFDVLGHITYPFRYLAKQGIQPPEARCADAIESILKAVIESGKGIEINVSTLFDNQPAMPSEKFAAMYRRLGGELITVGTDDHTGAYSALPARGMQLLKNAGFGYFTAFRGRKPTMIKID